MMQEYQYSGKNYNEPKEILGKTPNGKSIGLFFNPQNSNLYFVRFVEGGELPPELDQYFTGPQEARYAVEYYLAKRFNVSKPAAKPYIPEIEPKAEKVKGKRISKLQAALAEDESVADEEIQETGISGLVKIGKPELEPQFETYQIGTGE